MLVKTDVIYNILESDCVFVGDSSGISGHKFVSDRMAPLFSTEGRYAPLRLLILNTRILVKVFYIR